MSIKGSFHPHSSSLRKSLALINSCAPCILKCFVQRSTHRENHYRKRRDSENKGTKIGTLAESCIFNLDTFHSERFQSPPSSQREFAIALNFLVSVLLILKQQNGSICDKRKRCTFYRFLVFVAKTITECFTMCLQMLHSVVILFCRSVPYLSFTVVVLC